MHACIYSDTRTGESLRPSLMLKGPWWWPLCCKRKHRHWNPAKKLVNMFSYWWSRQTRTENSPGSQNHTRYNVIHHFHCKEKKDVPALFPLNEKGRRPKWSDRHCISQYPPKATLPNQGREEKEEEKQPDIYTQAYHYIQRAATLLECTSQRGEHPQRSERVGSLGRLSLGQNNDAKKQELLVFQKYPLVSVSKKMAWVC